MAFDTDLPNSNENQFQPSEGFSGSQPESSPSPEEQEEDVFVYEDAPNTYDPSDNPELEYLRERLESKPLPMHVYTEILEATSKRRFPLAIQFESIDDQPGSRSKPHVMSLGELAASAAHEKATQYIYPDRVERCLFGPHGIAKGYRLSNDIQITYFRRQKDGAISKEFVITSGRHRVTALILLLQSLAIPWEKQEIRVSTRVVTNQADFEQLIFDNNDSRVMKGAEKGNHKLGALGVNTASREAFYNDALNSVKHLRNTALCNRAFAAACRFETDGLSAYECDAISSRASAAFGQIEKVSPENKQFLRGMVTGNGPEFSDMTKLQEAAKFVVTNIEAAKTRGMAMFPHTRSHHAAIRGLAVCLAEHLGLTVPTYS